jgi:hypothetical protein
VESQKKIERVLESIVKVQGEIINKGENSRIEGLLSQTMTSIGSSMNGVITQETEAMLEKFKSNFESIENKFVDQKYSIIEDEGKEVIASLRNEIRARDEQLKNLIERKN